MKCHYELTFLCARKCIAVHLIVASDVMILGRVDFFCCQDDTYGGWFGSILKYQVWKFVHSVRNDSLFAFSALIYWIEGCLHAEMCCSDVGHIY